MRDALGARFGEHPRGRHAQESGGVLSVQEGALDCGLRGTGKMLHETRRKGRSESLDRFRRQRRTGVR